MALSVLSMSAANVIEKVSLSRIAPVTVAAVEVWATTAVLILLQLRRMNAIPRAGRSSGFPITQSIGDTNKLWHFVAAGISGQTIGTLTFLAAVKGGGIGPVVAIVQTWSLWALIMGIVFLGEKGNSRLAAGIPMALIGIVLLAPKSSGPLNIRGLLWAVVSSIGFAFSSVLIRRGLFGGVSRQQGLTAQYMTASVAMGLVLAATSSASLASLGLRDLLAVIAAGLLTGVVSMGFMYAALALCPVSEVVLINAAYPAVAGVLGWVVLGEAVTLRAVIGVGLIIAACVWTQTNDR